MAQGLGFRRWVWGPADRDEPTSARVEEALAWCRGQVSGERRVQYVSLILRKGGIGQPVSYESLGVFRTSDLQTSGEAARALERTLGETLPAGSTTALLLFDWEELLHIVSAD